jgi:serine/threonine protein phosphatase PrpC
MRGKMDCHGLTDIGQVRPANEDQFLIATLSKSLLIHQTSLSDDDHTRLFGGSQGPLLLVADGMGGHAAGKEASAIAVQALERYVLNTMPWFFRLEEDGEEDFKEELRSALEACQASIETAAAARPERRGMGTTLTMAYILWPRLYVVHVGDSRCYLYRDPTLEQITTDHTIAQQLVEKGALPAGEASGSRWSHVLWNCLGGNTHQLSPEVYKAMLKIGDTLLLCTDGLTNCVGSDVLIDLLRQDVSAEQTCHSLVDAARQAGAPDNVTVVVARFRDVRQADLHAETLVEEALPKQEQLASDAAVPVLSAHGV